ncbi:hypothetical protein Sango_1340400 [Sesamum angolense]|uniref:CCDC22 N-terminal domain-containing protein n=1 Tax=Sesamum angolense TaxID=2727404 RepID=A0AAE1WS84_9LAMI|nr:hypothetical protein Sango_1340400 [Sesamum angolense]
MEASEEILLNSLANSGVPIPAGVSSVHDLTPPTLFYVCSQALRLIDGPHHASSFPASLPEDSTPDRVKICTDLASAFNNLGFNPDLSFHKFLYPSKEDLYKLVRFLVGKLSEASGALTSGDGENVQSEQILTGLQDLRLKTQALESNYKKSQDDLIQRPAEPNSVIHNVEISVEESKPTEQDFHPNERCTGYHDSDLSEKVESSRKNATGDNDGSQNQELLRKPMMAKYSELQHADEERGLLEAALEMVLDDQHPLEFYIEQLNNQMEAKKQKLKELETEWDAKEKALQEEKRNLEQSLIGLYPEAAGKLTERREIVLETESILSEIKRREAKKDPVARQAYRLLTNIHESFEQIAENILATDRSRRDAADYEAKLAIITARSLNMDKLQADLAAIRKENDLLEQCLHNL